MQSCLRKPVSQGESWKPRPAAAPDATMQPHNSLPPLRFCVTSRLVQRESANRFTTVSQAAIAGLLIVWVLAAALISSNRHLHDFVHHDSKQTSHQCAISLLERGQTLHADVTTELVIRVSELTETAPAAAGDHFYTFHPLVNGTRGPPV